MSRSGRSWRRASTVGLVVLLLVDIALVALSLRSRGASDAGVALVVAPPATAAGTASVEVAASPTRPTATATATATAKATPTATREAVVPVPVTVMVSAVDADVAWRVRSGACGGSADPAVVERTQDGGRTWRAVDVPSPVVVRVRATSATKAFVVAAVSAADGCDASYRSTTDARTWTAPSRPHNAWYRSPSDPQRVILPNGRMARPCGSSEVIDLLPDGQRRAAALCSDERVVATTDTGRSWQRVASAPGAVALAQRPGASGYVVAALQRQGCDGVAVMTVASSPSRLGCVDGATAAPGGVAVASAAGSLRLLTGTTVQVSSDGGRTFARRS